ncbi:MAG: uridine phosphorylase [Desulfobacterium sp.]|nr:uridine phosphorylase [Desulfobacterium sp.]
MNSNEAIINPIRSPRSPDPGSLVILVSSRKDMIALCSLLQVKPDHSFDFMMSRICTSAFENHPFSVVGPMVGAPYAAILFENLIAWGARKFIFFGLCGSISPNVKIGDIILPTGSFIQEGTSLHYGKKTGEVSFCSRDILTQLKAAFEEELLVFQEGLVWTTDAVFRETKELVCTYQGKNALGVEMELSALCTIGNYRGVDIGAVLVVSDELSTFQWKPGFGEDFFKKQCKAVQRTISKLCPTLQPLK